MPLKKNTRSRKQICPIQSRKCSCCGSDLGRRPGVTEWSRRTGGSWDCRRFGGTGAGTEAVDCEIGQLYREKDAINTALVLEAVVVAAAAVV